jgi:hypothetical protein
MMEIERPLAVIEEMWKTSGGCYPEFGVKDTFDQLLSSPGVYAKIPSIKSVKPDSTCLVSYRGIVQHTFGIEMYQGIYRELNTQTGESHCLTSKYREGLSPSNPHCVFDADFDILHDSSLTYERLPLVVGVIPGEAHWVHEYAPEIRSGYKQQSMKRPAETQLQGSFIIDILLFTYHLDMCRCF